MSLIANRISEIEASKSVSLVAKVLELKKKGIPIISLSVGEPDMPPPPEVINEMSLAQARGEWGYGPVSGHPDLRELLATQLTKKTGKDIKKENVLISNGSKQILYNLFQTIINPGDEVLIPVPYWVTFPESVKLAGGRPIFVPCLPNHQLNLDAILKAITNKTKAIIINSPNNPTGAVFQKEDIKKLLEIAQKNNFTLISDEAYEYLTYDGKNYCSPLALSDLEGDHLLEQIMIVQTFSKSYAMTGYRVGQLIASTKVIQSMDKLQGHICGNVCTPAQAAAIKALTMPQDYFQKMKVTFERRRNLAHELYSQIFPLDKPPAAFYLFPKCDNYFKGNIKNSTDLANYILDEAQVALLPGIAFGLENYLRLSFATSEENIKESFIRIKNALSKL